MAIVPCPCCNKRISDRADVCQHCGYAFGDMDDEKRASQQRVFAIKRQQRIMTQQFLALLLFVGGFAVTFFDGELQTDWQRTAGQTMSAAGFIWYIALRIWLIFSKKQ
ncbi:MULTISPECIES: hypothetical protein [Corallincola]|uniref:Zinc ribbon domain-containing protein n=3 Tax=Corallincola TaxID=1775176 RepID=A0A368NKM0_9GAMM|nr:MULTISPECIES: hypothetical protein [Corallincola]RCU50413.1 hypothetical protein DU002_08285 [Corallincola holothuriorum]TAA48576.1 hypothetical protein EXY25_04975 [Corallincola spongiicola]TCI05565.1 hypothetical protein EZV61_06435 [Corallincola luteus]